MLTANTCRTFIIFLLLISFILTVQIKTPSSHGSYYLLNMHEMGFIYYSLTAQIAAILFQFLKGSLKFTGNRLNPVLVWYTFFKNGTGKNRIMLSKIKFYVRMDGSLQDPVVLAFLTFL